MGPGERADDVINLFICHLGKHRQLQRVCRHVLAYRAGPLAQAAAAVESEEVTRPVKTVDAVDTMLMQQALAQLRSREASSGSLNEQGVNVVRVEHPGVGMWRYHAFQLTDRVGVPRRDLAAPGDEIRQLFELRLAHCGLRLGHPVIAGDVSIYVVHIVGPRARRAVLVRIIRVPATHGAPPGDLDGEFIFARRYHAPFPQRGHIFYRVEAEAANITERACETTLVLRALRVGAILDNEQVMLACRLKNGVHVTHLAGQMGDEDGLRPGRDAGLDPLGVNVPCLSVDVDEDRDRALAEDGLARRYERERRGQHLVARTDT